MLFLSLFQWSSRTKKTIIRSLSGKSFNRLSVECTKWSNWSNWSTKTWINNVNWWTVLCLQIGLFFIFKVTTCGELQSHAWGTNWQRVRHLLAWGKRKSHLLPSSWTKREREKKSLFNTLAGWILLIDLQLNFLSVTIGEENISPHQVDRYCTNHWLATRVLLLFFSSTSELNCPCEVCTSVVMQRKCWWKVARVKWTKNSLMVIGVSILLRLIVDRWTLSCG